MKSRTELARLDAIAQKIESGTESLVSLNDATRRAVESRLFARSNRAKAEAAKHAQYRESQRVAPILNAQVESLLQRLVQAGCMIERRGESNYFRTPIGERLRVSDHQHAGMMRQISHIYVTYRLVGDSLVMYSDDKVITMDELIARVTA